MIHWDHFYDPPDNSKFELLVERIDGMSDPEIREYAETQGWTNEEEPTAIDALRERVIDFEWNSDGED